MRVERPDQQFEWHEHAKCSHKKEDRLAPPFVRQSGQQETEEEAAETCRAKQITHRSRGLLRHFGDIERRENILEKQPTHETRCSDAAKPHIPILEDRKIIAQADLVPVNFAARFRLRFLDVKPDQNRRNQSRRASYKKGPAPAEASRNLGG